MSNTEQDFLKTVDSEDSYITCPACGSPIGIRAQGYEMILTENFRHELDTSLRSLRLLLSKIEVRLEQRNIPLDPLSTGEYPYSQERDFYSEDKSNEDEDKEESVDNLSKRVLGSGGKYRGTLGEDAARSVAA